MFKTYDSNSPVVYLHLFKTAGSSINEMFKQWFSSSFFKHKDGSNVVKNLTCSSDRIQMLKSKGIHNPCFFGHFNGNGTYKWPIECNQFITMIRDPLETQTSAYFYNKRKNLIQHAKNVEEYVLTTDFHYSLSNIFTKKKLELTNYKEILSKYFLCIGSLKNYKKSLEVFSNTLGFILDENLLKVRKNVSSNEDEYYVPEHLRSLHRELFQLEYEIYDYVNAFYEY